jgi:inhibitor of KinA sporulation pathway (predicted exonuclease)
LFFSALYPRPIGRGFTAHFAKYFKQRGLKRKVGVRKALAQNNLEFIGRPHSGIDDVRNIARLLKYINI